MRPPGFSGPHRAQRTRQGMTGKKADRDNDRELDIVAPLDTTFRNDRIPRVQTLRCRHAENRDDAEGGSDGECRSGAAAARPEENETECERDDCACRPQIFDPEVEIRPAAGGGDTTVIVGRRIGLPRSTNAEGGLAGNAASSGVTS